MLPHGLPDARFVACLLILTPHADHSATVLDGFQATKRIRELEDSGELPDHLPIIALTANVTQESEGDCKAAGMDHFLPKPLKMAGTSLRNIFVSITYSFFLQT